MAMRKDLFIYLFCYCMLLVMNMYSNGQFLSSQIIKTLLSFPLSSVFSLSSSFPSHSALMVFWVNFGHFLVKISPNVESAYEGLNLSSNTNC